MGALALAPHPLRASEIASPTISNYLGSSEIATSGGLALETICGHLGSSKIAASGELAPEKSCGFQTSRFGCHVASHGPSSAYLIRVWPLLRLYSEGPSTKRASVGALAPPPPAQPPWGERASTRKLIQRTGSSQPRRSACVGPIRVDRVRRGVWGQSSMSCRRNRLT